MTKTEQIRAFKDRHCLRTIRHSDMTRDNPWSAVGMFGDAIQVDGMSEVQALRKLCAKLNIECTL